MSTPPTRTTCPLMKVEKVAEEQVVDGRHGVLIELTFSKALCHRTSAWPVTGTTCCSWLWRRSLGVLHRVGGDSCTLASVRCRAFALGAPT